MASVVGLLGLPLGTLIALLVFILMVLRMLLG